MNFAIVSATSLLSNAKPISNCCFREKYSEMSVVTKEKGRENMNFSFRYILTEAKALIKEI